MIPTRELTREEMIQVLKTQPGVKISHPYFAANEFIVGREDGNVYDENDYLFEDWYNAPWCGVRMRSGGNWETGWYIKK